MAVPKNHELDWLPPGWKVEDKVKNGRKVRCFINVKNSQRLYSKASVIRQVNKSRRNSQGSHSQLPNGRLTRSSRNKEIPTTTEPNDCNDSLPPGWILEVKTRKNGVRAGQDYKVYTETSTGKVFYSKPEVTRYLKGKEKSNGSPERKKSDTLAESSVKGSVRILRRHKPDHGEEGAPHPKFDEGKSVEVALHRKSKEGKSEEVPRRPKSNARKTKELSRDPKFDEGKREMAPQHLKLDERKKEEVPQYREFTEGKAKEVTHDPKFDEREKDLPQDPNFDEGKKSQPSKTRKGPVRVLRHRKPDQVEELVTHLKSDDGKSKEVLQHPRFNEGKAKELPSEPKIDDGKSEMLPLHSKLDERKKEHVLQHPEFNEGKAEEVTEHPRLDEGKKSQASKKRKGSVRVLRHHKPDQGEEVALHPEFYEGKSKEAAQHPNFHEGKAKEFERDPKLDEGKREMGPLNPKLDESKIEEVPQHGKIDKGKAEEVTQHLRLDEEKREEVPQDPKLEEGQKSQLSKKRKVIVETEIAEGLPSGWIKEIRIKEYSNGVRKDPFYVNPSSGYVFRSRVDVLRYLETGEISRHAYKRKNRCGNILQSTQKSPSDSTVRSNTAEDLNERQLFTGADVDPIAIESENKFSGVELSKDKGETGNWNSESREREFESNRNKMDSSRRSSKRLAGVEIEPVTHSVAIERALRSANKNSDKIETVQSQKASQDESATDVQRKEQSKDMEETGKKSSERTLKRKRKKLFDGIEVDPVTSEMASGRVLRSAIKPSTITEPMPTVASDQGQHALEAPQSTNIGSEDATIPSKSEKQEFVFHNTDPAPVPSKNEKRISERKPKRSRKQIVSVSPHRSSGPEQGQQAPLAINLQANNIPEEQTVKPSLRSNNTHQTTMIDFSRNTIGGQTTLEPERNVFTDQMFKEPPKINSNNGTEKEQQDSPFSFPWSDPCIEFAYKTLTGALPLDDTVVMHDYVQHQIRTGSTSSNNNFTHQDSRPPGFSLNTVPSNSSNSITFPDPGPPGFSRGSAPSSTNDRFALPEARPPGFSYNATPSNRGNSLSLPDARPPGFSLNEIPSDSGNNAAFPDTMPPGFSLNDVPPTPPGFPLNGVPASRGNSLAFPDTTPPGFSPNNNSIAFPDSGPPGFSRSSVPSNSSNTPPGFTRSNVSSNRSDNFALPETMPAGFSLSNRSNIFAVPDTKPPGFSAPANSNDYFTLPGTRSPGFSLNSAPSNNTDHFALPDARPPGFSLNSAPSNSNNDRFAPPYVSQPAFSRNSVPLNSRNDHFALPDVRKPDFPQSSPPPSSNTVPSNSRNDHFALPDVRKPDFPQNSLRPSNNGNYVLPDTGFPWRSNNLPSNNGTNANPPGFSWSGFPLDSGINLNVAFTDDGPPGFSEKAASSSKQQQQVQDVSPAAPHTQAADFPLQGSMFSSWNRNLR